MRQVLADIFGEIFASHSRQDAIPPMDGVWTPNDLLDHAPRLVEGLKDPHDLCAGPSGEMYIAENATIIRLGGTQLADRKLIATAHAPVLSLSWHDTVGLIACLDGIGVECVEGPMKGASFPREGMPNLSAPRAAVVGPNRKLYVAEASAGTSGEHWVQNFLSRGRAGRILEFDLDAGEQRELCNGLAYPTSLILSPDERTLYFTEAWKAEVCSLSLSGGGKTTVLRNLPAYPWRLTTTQTGSLITFFSMRTQLIEFLLEEDRFLAKMMRDVPREHWIAPALRSSTHVFDPVQGGQLLQHGKAKAWAPSPSYGLVAELDATFTPRKSYHSRFAGEAHGIVSAGEIGGRRLALSAGAGALIDLGPA